MQQLKELSGYIGSTPAYPSSSYNKLNFNSGIVRHITNSGDGNNTTNDFQNAKITKLPPLLRDFG